LTTARESRQLIFVKASSSWVIELEVGRDKQREKSKGERPHFEWKTVRIMKISNWRNRKKKEGSLRDFVDLLSGSSSMACWIQAHFTSDGSDDQSAIPWIVQLERCDERLD
jgi:hypothetical protein